MTERPPMTDENRPNEIPEMNPVTPRRRRRKVILAIAILAAAGLAALLLIQPGSTPKGETRAGAAAEQKGQKWFCPMHPHIVSEEPGNCPICKMELAPLPAGNAPTPSGAMETSAAGSAPGAQVGTSGRRVLYWYDPMAPGSKFDKPGKSPFMDMQLVPKYADEGTRAGAPGSQAAAPPVSLSAAAIRATGVATVPVTKQDLSHEIRSVGVIEANETRLEHVAARVPGRVEKLYVNFTGQQVPRGAPLFDLYSPDLVATQREYLLALEQLRRLSSTATPGSIESAQALVSAARDRLKLWGIGDEPIRRLEQTGRPDLALTFRSPISGTVLQKNVFEGQYVAEGTDLYLLADLSSVWLVAQVYEYELGRLRAGQPVEVTVSAYPGRDFQGKIAFIEPVLERETRTARVRIVLPNPRGELKPGMFANAVIQVPLGEVLSVPRSAVIDTGARQVVYVETSPGTFMGREVKLGASAGDRREVLQGLKEGERVVAAANFFVDSQAQLAGGSSIQWSGALDVKTEPTPRSRP